MSLLPQIFSLPFFLYHALYLSVIEIDIKNGHVEKMQVKIFADDLADAVRAETGIIVPFNENYRSEHLKAIEDYFDNHLFIKRESEIINFTVQGFSTEGEAKWFELDFHYDIKPKDILVADYIMEIFQSQVNVIKLSIDGSHHFLKAEKGKKEFVISM